MVEKINILVLLFGLMMMEICTKNLYRKMQMDTLLMEQLLISMEIGCLETKRELNQN